MSYCRFENTSRDLADCLEAIENDEIYDLSLQERAGLKRLLAISIEIVELEDRIIEGCTG
jgi:hypothetical protein